MVSADFFTTKSGMRVDYKNFSADHVRIEDIAHALSHVCRFGGHVDRHYSVAEHSLLVAEMVPDRMKLAALMHDASEAYISDMIKPIKKLLPDYQALERSIQDAIDERFGIKLNSVIEHQIRVADVKALFIEARSFYGMIEVRDWNFHESILEWGKTSNRDVLCYAPAPLQIKKQFMNAFLAYGGKK